MIFEMFVLTVLELSFLLSPAVWQRYLFILRIWIRKPSLFGMLYTLGSAIFKISFRSKTTEESLIAYLRCLEELAFCILLICEFPKFSGPSKSLFPQLAYAKLPMAPFPSHDNLGPPINLTNLRVEITEPETFKSPMTSPSRYNELVDFFDLIHQDVFYGRAIAFYLDTSAQSFFRMLGSIMAGFADSYQVRPIVLVYVLLRLF